MRRAVSVVLLLALASCAHGKAWQATGESIDALGQTFLLTAKAVDTAYDAKHLSEAEYARWRTFVRYFKPTYDMAADRWLHGDDTATEHAAVVLAALAAELATFTAMGAK